MEGIWQPHPKGDKGCGAIHEEEPGSQRYGGREAIMVKHEGRRVDALALRADEGRDKLRKASGRSKYPLIRRYPNGETHMRRPHVSIRQSITYGGEPPELKHLSRARKRKKHRFPK